MHQAESERLQLTDDKQFQAATSRTHATFEFAFHFRWTSLAFIKDEKWFYRSQGTRRWIRSQLSVLQVKIIRVNYSSWQNNEVKDVRQLNYCGKPLCSSSSGFTRQYLKQLHDIWCHHSLIDIPWQLERPYEGKSIKSDEVDVFVHSKFFLRMKNIIKCIVPSFNRNQLFEIDYKVLTLVGFRPDRMINLRSTSIFVLCLLLEVIPEFYFIVKHKHNVQAVFMCLHEFVSLLVFVLKTIIFFINRHKLASLVTGLTTEWSNCEFR